MILHHDISCYIRGYIHGYMDISLDVCTDISRDISLDVSMDISADTIMGISMSYDLMTTGSVVARSGDHAKGAVRGQRILPKRGRAVALFAWDP